MYDLKPGQLIEVNWLDPAVGSTWIDAEDVIFWKFRCRSVGYVYATTDEGLIITACYGVDPDGNKSLLLRQYIPWASITEVWILNA